MSDMVAFWGNMNTQALTIVVFTWLILNSVILLDVVRERLSKLKKYQESHG